MRTEFRVETVDIEADVDALREALHDVVDLLCPCRAGVLSVFQIAIEEGRDAGVTGNHVGFFLTIVADPHLHEVADQWNPQRVPHDRRVREREALIGVAEVRMGVNLENPERLPL